MRTSEDAMALGLYISDCCDQELIFDIGDTFCRCPKCMSLCIWDLQDSITRVDDVEDEMMPEEARYSASCLAVA